jgi:hypothetical protein
MEREIAVLWDKDLTLRRYLTDRGFSCDLLVPAFLAAPFFSWRACRLMIVPAGFGNAGYSQILPTLRAHREFITNFVKAGGRLLVWGAFSSRDAYNWLPVPLQYVHEERMVGVKRLTGAETGQIVERDECYCDGYFEDPAEGWTSILVTTGSEAERAILVAAAYGAGELIATTIHEYPTDRFIAYCVGR